MSSIAQGVPGQQSSNPEQQSQNMQAKLVQKIHEKRVIVKEFARKQKRRTSLLTNLNIACTAVTAAFTAGPAFGGEKFTEGVQKILSLNSDSTVWRTLCLVALIISLIAVIANNIYRSNDMATRLAKAQTSSALLEGLETMVEFGIYSVEDGTKMFHQYLSDVAFIDGV